MENSKIKLIFPAIFAIIIESIAFTNMQASVFFIVACILLVIEINFTYGAVLLVLSLLLSNDLNRTIGEVVSPVPSIYLYPYMNVAIVCIMAVFISIFLLSKRRIKLDREIYRFVSGILLIALLSLVVGAPNILIHTRVVIHDISYFINTTVLAVFVYLVFNTEKKLKLLLYSIIIAVSTKYIILTIQFFLGYGNLAGSMVQVVFDTGKKIVPIFSVLYFVFWMNRRKMKLSALKVFLIVMMFSFTILLSLSIASRSTLLFLVLMLFVAVWLQHGKRALSLLKYSVYLVLSLGIGLFVIDMIHPDSIKYILWKIRSSAEIGIDNYHYSSTSTVIRYISFLNIYYQHLRDLTIFLGAGAGSFFTTDFVGFSFSLYGKTAFSNESIAMNQYFKPHTTPIFLFLKIGLLGTAYYYWIYWRVFIYAKAKLSAIDDLFLRLVLISLITSIPILSINNFSSKMQIVSGIMFGIIFSIASVTRLKATNRQGNTNEMDSNRVVGKKQLVSRTH